MRLVLWSVCLIACGSKTEAPPAPQPEPRPQPVPIAPACDSTLADAAKRIATESQRVALDTMAERIRLTMTASCEAEAWPASVMKCIAAARLDVDLTSCTEQLPHEQYQRLHKKIVQLAVIPTTRAPPAVAVATPRPARPRPLPNGGDLMEPGALKKLDCAKAILDGRDSACRKQYCTYHTTDARCMIE